jgi:hypothetical protein
MNNDIPAWRALRDTVIERNVLYTKGSLKLGARPRRPDGNWSQDFEPANDLAHSECTGAKVVQKVPLNYAEDLANERPPVAGLVRFTRDQFGRPHYRNARPGDHGTVEGASAAFFRFKGQTRALIGGELRGWGEVFRHDMPLSEAEAVLVEPKNPQALALMPNADAA